MRGSYVSGFPSFINKYMKGTITFTKSAKGFQATVKANNGNPIITFPGFYSRRNALKAFIKKHLIDFDKYTIVNKNSNAKRKNNWITSGL